MVDPKEYLEISKQNKIHDINEVFNALDIEEIDSLIEVFAIIIDGEVMLMTQDKEEADIIVARLNGTLKPVVSAMMLRYWMIEGFDTALARSKMTPMYMHKGELMVEELGN